MILTVNKLSLKTKQKKKKTIVKKLNSNKRTFQAVKDEKFNVRVFVTFNSVKNLKKIKKLIFI